MHVFGNWMGHAGKSMNCLPDTWMCQNKHRCIQYSRYCDGRQDCEDNSDERFCTAPSKIVIQGKNQSHEFRPV